MIVEILQSYAPQIIQGLAIIGTVAPFLRARVVSDKNLIKTFDDIKKTAKSVNWKEIDITKSIDRINGQMDRLQKDFIYNQKQIEQTVMEFAKSDFVAEMREGVSLIKEFKEVLAVKDNTIQTMMSEFKTVTKELQEIKNQLKG